MFLFVKNRVSFVSFKSLLMSTRDVIRSVVAERRWDALRSILEGMTNMEFKRTETLMRENVLPDLPNDLMWETLYNLILYRRQAFITCIMAAGKLAKEGALSFDSPSARALSDHLHQSAPDSVAKIVSIALPCLVTEAQVEQLFECFRIDEPRSRIAILLKSESPTSYYVLFNSLKRLPECQDLVRRCCVYIMKRNNDMAYNMVSILRSYFGITDLKSQLSLRVEPYELSLVDRSYQSFLVFLNGKRPKV